jgi:molybdate transport repressor ModE-like protein
LNSIFSDPVAVNATGGRGHGRTELTPLALQVIRLYRKFDVEIQARASKYFVHIGANKVRTVATAPIVRLSAR